MATRTIWSTSTGHRSGKLIYLDTHVVAFLYEDAGVSLPPFSRELLAGNELLLSLIVMVELEYLFEAGRLTVDARTIIAAIQIAAPLRLCDLPFEDVARAALQERWTGDPFDRIIVAQARLREAALITKDRAIREHYTCAVWARPRSGG